jgi:hypothetical protein
VLEFANFPLLLEIPTIKDTLMIKCSWLSIEDIILPGLLICYLYRYDTNNNSRVYTSIGVSALFLGILTWIISSVAASRAQISLPQSMFVFTFIIVGTVLWAYKQGDLKSLWMGHFYDKAVMHHQDGRSLNRYRSSSIQEVRYYQRRNWIRRFSRD